MVGETVSNIRDVVTRITIENDKRRSRIHRILKGFGQWMQYSACECDLTRGPYLVLCHRLYDYIKTADGNSVRFYFLCEDARKKSNVSAAKYPIREELSLCKFFLGSREHHSYHVGIWQCSQI
jgi:CRISPR-associated protein Cas2